MPELLRRTVYVGPSEWQANNALQFYSSVDFNLPYVFRAGAGVWRWWMEENEQGFCVVGELQR